MEVEYLILADAAQVVGNKLYLLGGGWDRLTVNSGFPYEHRCGVAVGIKVPWHETNQKHTLEVELFAESPATEEPKSLGKVTGQFEVGRPPGLRQGREQLFQVAIDMGFKIEGPGEMAIVVRIEGQEMVRRVFEILPGPTLSVRRQH